MSLRLRLLFTICILQSAFCNLASAATTAEDFRLNSSTHRPINSALDLSTTTTTFADSQIPQAKVSGLATSLAAKAADAAVVHNTGPESVAGVKTFLSAPVVPANSFPESAIASLVPDLAAINVSLGTKALESAVVHNTGAEGIAGVKTYSSAPVVPAGAFPESAIANLGTDLSNLQPLDPDLTLIAGVATNSYGRGALALADGSAFITYLGKTTLAGYGITDPIAKTDTANTFIPLQTFNSFASYSVNATQLSNPGAPSITNVGTAGATTWTYKIVAKLADGSTTAAGTAGTTTAGNATLDATNKNSLTWTAVTGASTYDVYRTVAGLVPSSLGKIANVSSAAYIDAGAAGDLTTAPAVNSTGGISAANGTFSGNGTFGGSMTVASTVNSATLNTSSDSAIGGNSSVHGNETVGGTFTGTGPVIGPVRDKGGKVFDVRNYGGLPDDSTDNATAIVAALAAAGSNSTLYFAKGTWRSSRVDVSTPNVTLAGDGLGRTNIKKVNGATSSDSSIVFLTTNAATNFTIRDLTLDGNRANQGTYINIGSNSVLYIAGSGTTVENVEVKGSCFSGIFVGDTAIAPDRVTISHCWIHDNGGVLNSSGNGIGITAAGNFLPTRLTIERCTIESNYNTVTQPNDSTGLNLAIGPGAIISNNYFKNNFNVGGGQMGISDGGTGTWLDLSITGNVVQKTTTFGGDSTNGIEVFGKGFTIDGNIVDGFTSIGIYCEGPTYGQGAITGNTIKNGLNGIGLYGLTTDAVTDVTVTGNTLINVTTGGIQLSPLHRNIIITGNNFLSAADPYTVTGGTRADLDSSIVISKNLTNEGVAGELRSATSGSAVSLTNGTPATSVSLTLPKGVWDLSGWVAFTMSSTTNVSSLRACISGTTNTFDFTVGNYDYKLYGTGFVQGFADALTSQVRSRRVALSTSTTFYLVVQGGFSLSTLTATGVISATKVDSLK
jgi:hypothetical protein